MALILVFLAIAAVVSAVVTIVLYGLWMLVKNDLSTIVVASIGFIALAAVWLNNP